MAEQILKTDNLNEGRVKLNAAIDASDRAESKSDSAVSTSQQAVQTADTAEQKADNVQSQFNQVVIEGDSSVEAAQARVDETGNAYTTLKERLDTENAEVTSKLAQEVNYSTTNFNYLSDAKKIRKCMVSFIADDAPKNDLTKLLPIMQEKNIPVGIGVITDRVGKTVTVSTGDAVDYMTWDDIKYMESRGAEIMAHSHQHRVSTQLTEQELYEDMETCKRILSEHGYIADGFIYPNNASSDFTKNIVKRFFKYSFTGNGSLGNFPTMSNNGITRINLGAIGDEPEEGFPQDTLSLEYYKARVDWSLENDNWLVFVLHTAISGQLEVDQQQHLKDTIDYIRSLSIEIVSPREGFERYGNIVQQGEKTFIDANGTRYRDVVFLEKDSRSLNSTIEEFPIYTVSYMPITVNIQGASTNTSILITYNLEVIDGRRFQYFIETTYFSGDPIQKTMTRHWVKGVWSPWKNANTTTIGSDVGSANSGLLTKPITDYDMHHITINQIKPAIATGYPDNSGGTLTTYRLGIESHHQYQEYKALIIYGGTDPVRKSYVRYWLNDDWTPWKLESQTT